MEEFKKLKRVSKNFIEKDKHKKVNSLCCLDEKKETLKFLILSELKMKHLELEVLLKQSKDHEDFHFLILKSSLIPPKITFLQENFEEKDFKKILALLDELEMRLFSDGSI
jgi:hypothetical protein